MKLQILGVASLGVALLGVQARAETINFDNLGSFVTVTNQYPNVIFSANGGDVVLTYQQAPPYQSSPSNLICTGPAGGPADCTSDITLTFTTAVDNLTFNAFGNQTPVGGTFAVAAVYQGGVNPTLQQNLTVSHTQAQDLAANCQIMDCLADPQTLNYIGISKVVIHSNNDPAGTAYDDFSFAVESSAPEPSTLLLTGLCGIVWAGRRFLGRKSL